MKAKKICFYHSADLDGHCSGAIVKQHAPDCEMVGFNYGDEFPWEKIERGMICYMVDLSLPMEDMERLRDMTQFVWIDHHQTAIDDYEDYFKPNARSVLDGRGSIMGLRQVGKAACELCWEYFYQQGCYEHHPLPVPTPVYLAGRYDVWDHSAHRHVLTFHYGVKNYCTNPANTPFWEELLFNDSEFGPDLYNEIIGAGEVIERYQSLEDETYVKARAFQFEWAGLRWLAVNKMFCGSKVFDSIIDWNKWDAVMCFGMKMPATKDKDQQIVFSIYTERDDLPFSLGALAQKYGGGGHAKAAGFAMRSFPGVTKTRRWDE